MKHIRTQHGIAASVMLTAVLIMTAMVPIHAQELVKELEEYHLKYFETGVREVDADTWLVSHNDGLSYSGVAMVHLDSAQVDDMVFFDNTHQPHPSYHMDIIDMQINNDTVFFIGRRYVDWKYHGVVGHFPLQGFPFSQVTVFDLGMNNLPTRIRTYASRNGRTHLLVIWRNSINSQYTVADFHPAGPYHYDVFTVHPHFDYQPPSYDIVDDIIALDNYVVFSARSSFDHKVSLHFFNKYTSGFSPFLNHSRSVRFNDFTPTRTTGLAAGPNNEFALAIVFDFPSLPPIALNDVYPIYPQNFSTFFFNGQTPFRQVVTQMPYSSDSIVDMAYDPYNNVCDIVIYEDSTISGKIYHVKKYGNYLSTPYHTYDRQEVMRLEYLKHNPGHMAATTRAINWSGPFNINRYGYNDWSHCATPGSERCYSKDFELSELNFETFILDTEYNGVVFDHDTLRLPVFLRCEE